MISVPWFPKAGFSSACLDVDGGYVFLVASKTVAAAPGGTPRLGKKYDTFPPFAHRLDPGASQTKLGQFVSNSRRGQRRAGLWDVLKRVRSIGEDPRFDTPAQHCEVKDGQG